jgi:hypothetical protein
VATPPGPTTGAWSCAGRGNAVKVVRIVARIGVRLRKRLILVPILFPLCLFFFIFVVFVLVVIEVLGGFVPFTLRLKLNGIDASNRQRSSALIAGKNVPFVQFFFFHIDGSITFWTVDHGNNPFSS